MDEKELLTFRTALTRFVPLNDEDWGLLTPYVTYRNLAKGEHWITEGKKEQYLGFILEGNMRHYYIRNGEEKTTYFYFENHLTGSYFSALNGAASLVAIEALTDCRLLSFPYKVLVSLYDESHAWERFGRILAEYLALGLEERMTELLMLSPEERYIKLIEGNKKKIIERIPQHYIANYLGITPVSLSRIRKRLTSK